MTKDECIYYVKSLGGIETPQGWDVPERVIFIDKNLTEIPIKFNIVNGDFSCAYNKLTSLKYCPKEVKGNFDCSHNNLISLKYSPKIVQDSFYCENNQLTSLKNCPKEVKGYFFCYNNQLTSYKYSPKIVQRKFWCDKGHFAGKEYYKLLLNEKLITKEEFLLKIL